MIPDAWFELAVGAKRPVAIAIELDRGSEDQKRWRAKVAALAAWALGPYQQAFSADTLTIAVVTPDAARRDQLRTWTVQELTRIGQPELAEIFLFTDADRATDRHPMGPQLSGEKRQGRRGQGDGGRVEVSNGAPGEDKAFSTLRFTRSPVPG